MTTKKTRYMALLALILVNISGWGCSEQGNGLELADLDVSEREYITRYMTIERARAVENVDPVAGRALLDSLGIAWGDSAVADARLLMPPKMSRVIEINKLLVRLLAADEDSLVNAPRADRLRAPLPDLSLPVEP